MRPSLVEEVRVGSLGPLCAERGQQVWLVGSEPGEGVSSCTVWRCPSSVGPQDGWVSGIPVEVTGSVAFSMGSFAGFFPPSDPPSSTPRSALAGSFGTPQKSVSSSCPQDAGGHLHLLASAGRRRAHLLSSQGALPEGFPRLHL